MISCFRARLKKWWEGGCSRLVLNSRNWGLMPWFSLVPLFLLSMNGLQTEFIDSCARELGSKRLRIQLPWDQTRFENLIERRQQPVIRGPDWVDFPLQLFSHAEAVAKPAKLDRFNTKFHLSEVSWVASENKKLNLALQYCAG